MASLNRASREVPRPTFGTSLKLCPMHGLPVADGANDSSQPPPQPPPSAAPNNTTDWKPPTGIPVYDVERDATTVPFYTRDHLKKLSARLGTRLAKTDDSLKTYSSALSRIKRFQWILMAIMLMLGALWIVTAIISIISILKGNRFQTNLLKQRLE